MLVLVALARLGPSGERDVLVTAFGLLAGVGIVSDSGAGNFLLTTDPARISRRVFQKVLGVHLTTAMAGSVFVLLVLVLLGESLSRVGIAVILALSITQVLDSAVRVAKAPLLTQGRDGAYGTVDVVAASIKFPIILLAFLFDDLRLICVLPIASAIIFSWVLKLAWSQVPAVAGPPISRLLLRVLEIGASGALTALYSQAPLFIGTATLSISDAAKLSAATRIVQALEFVPSTLAAQAMPRLRRDSSQTPRWWACLVLLGLAMAGLVVAARGPLEQVLTLDLGPTLLLILLCAGLTLKCGNYILVAGLLTRSLARLRLALSVGVGCIALALCVVAARLGLSWFGAAALFAEVALAVGAAIILLRHRAE